MLKSTDLKSRIARGSILVGAGNGIEQFLRLIRNMLLTRMLAPEAFGIMAIILAINAAFESFTQIGIKEAVIQNPRGHERTYLNGAWWLALGRSLILYSIVYITVPLFSRLYNNPDFVPLMRVAFLNLFFTGLMSTKAYVAIKQMRFKKWVFLFNGGGVIGIVTTVILAIIINNVWALVIGFVVEALARCILSYVLCPYLPGFDFDKKNLFALLKYAQGMFGLPILTFIFMKADIFVIGKLCPMSELGLYSMASLTAWTLFNFITMIIGQVLMPAFSEKQTDNVWINTWILNISYIIAIIGFPLLFFVILYGKECLSLLYGNQYGVVAIPFAIIFATALFRTISVPIASVYLAVGRPELHRFFTAIRAVLIIVLIFPAMKFFGLIGAASSVLISMLIGYLFQIKRMERLTELDLKEYFTYFSPVILISSFVLLFGFVIKNFFSLSSTLIMLPGFFSCIFAYVMNILFFIRAKKLTMSYFKF